MQTVYIETTIPSYYFDRRTTPKSIAWRQSTRLWWDRHRHHYQLVVSNFVIQELLDAPEPKSSAALSLLEGLRTIATTDEIEAAAAFYLRHKLVPRESKIDALHLAHASACRADFLLTWNCRHLANANKTAHIHVLNTRLGLHVPIVTTPLTLLPEGH